MKTVLLCSALAATTILATIGGAHASIVTVGDLGADPTSSTGAFQRSLGTLTGSFNDAFTFTLDRPESLTIASLTNVFPSKRDFIASFTAGVFSGTPATPGSELLGPASAVLGCGQIKLCQSIVGTAVLPKGSYFLNITGIASGHSGYGGNLATVAATPLPAALPLFGGGLGILGWLASRRRNHNL